MNRRSFFAAALPVLLGAPASAVLGQNKAAGQPAPGQVKVKVDVVRAKPEDVEAFTKAHPGFNLPYSRREISDLLVWLSVAPASAIRTVTVTTNDGVPTHVTVTEPTHGQNAAAAPAAGVTIQHFSTSIGVTPHVNADGTITLQLSLEDSQYSLAPDPEAPRHILTLSVSTTRTGDAGEVLSLGTSQPAPDGRELLFFVTPTVVQS